jgi:hypothetical protein
MTYCMIVGPSAFSTEDCGGREGGVRAALAVHVLAKASELAQLTARA